MEETKQKVGVCHSMYSGTFMRRDASRVSNQKGKRHRPTVSPSRYVTSSTYSHMHQGSVPLVSLTHHKLSFRALTITLG